LPSKGCHRGRIRFTPTTYRQVAPSPERRSCRDHLPHVLRKAAAYRTKIDRLIKNTEKQDPLHEGIDLKRQRLAIDVRPYLAGFLAPDQEILDCPACARVDGLHLPSYALVAPGGVYQDFQKAVGMLGTFPHYAGKGLTH